MTRALGVNDSGQIVGDYLDAGGKTHGYLLNEGSYTTLDVRAYPVNPLIGPKTAKRQGRSGRRFSGNRW
jgi:probable HAF family extracellular repeat protein